MPPPNNPTPSSSSSSHAFLEPVSGTTLLTAALARRAALAARGPLATGCAELDDAVLLGGGFERGCVVGVSAEEDDVALVLGLQTVARALGKGKGRAMVITTMGAGAVVAALRGVLGGLGVCRGEGEGEREVLGRVDVARVFDVFGLWEVLAEVDGSAVGGTPPEMGLRKDGEDERTAGQRQDGDLSVHADEDEDEDRFRRSGEAAPAQTDAPGIDYDHTLNLMHTPPAHQPEEQTPAEPLSSPLSNPPSTLPDTPPWETIERLPPNENEANVDAVEQLTKTPPGQREVIQDSEEEEGFSSPLEPAKGDSLGTTSMVASVIRYEEQSSSLTHPTPTVVDLLTIHTPPSEQSKEPEQSVQADSPAVEAPEIEQEDNVTLQAASTDESRYQESKTRSGASAAEPSEHVHVEQESREPPTKEQQAKRPDIILITHMSTLLSTLFHQRDKATAHQNLQLLASHLRYLTRSPEHGGPLIMILNSTTSSDINIAAPQHDQDSGCQHLTQPSGGPRTSNRPLDPTLRSIFNPPPLPVSGLSYTYDTPHSRRNKPSFGLIFTQMLDMHLLCTKIPKTRMDAEALYAPASPGMGKRVEYVWAVEVLLDDMGLWEGRKNVLEGKPRKSREQRWGAVQIKRDDAGMRLVDAFEKKAPKRPQDIVLAAGFGGPRV